MLFFQLMLLAGYCYAHLSLQHLRPAQQAWLHVALMVLALITLPITPENIDKPLDSSQPTAHILWLLLRSVGLPFVVLAATSPLLQAWFARLEPQRSPYPLYALSNLGSLIALLSYPFLFEPYFPLGQQTRDWSWGFLVFSLLMGSLAWDFRRLTPLVINTNVYVQDPTLVIHRFNTLQRWFYWLALPTASSALLLAITNALCQDVASIPFLWIVPLMVYLLSFIVCFSQRIGYHRPWCLPAAVIGIGGLIAAQYNSGSLSLAGQVVIYSFGLFSCCLLVHGELYRLRPEPHRLTAYYLASACGGAIGGLFVALAAPLLFPIYLEFPISLLACFGISLLAIAQQSSHQLWQRRYLIGASGSLLLLGATLFHLAYQNLSAQISVTRNFYGVLRVEERDANQPDSARRVLRHGAIDHGFQYLAEDKQHWATAYYRPETGVGLAIRYLPTQQQRRIGLVGLGVGTLLSYTRADDVVNIYEINQEVVNQARRYFSYLRDSQAQQQTFVADARLALERQPSQQFDLLVLDAFSGDSVPMHLLTQQAVQIYLRHLAADGVLAVHITNHYLNLKPLIRGLANRNQLYYGFIKQAVTEEDHGLYRSHWALLTRNPAFFGQETVAQALSTNDDWAEELVWTDDFSNLYSLLK